MQPAPTATPEAAQQLEPTPMQSAVEQESVPVALRPKVLEQRGHDPEAFTQGLEFDDGRLYESRGRNGMSGISEIEPRDGSVLRWAPLADEYFGEGYKGASARAEKLMRRSGVQTNTLFKVGDPVNTIVRTAGDNHIIIMGASTKSPITKFFKGSKPLNVIKACNCPVLIVK